MTKTQVLKGMRAWAYRWAGKTETRAEIDRRIAICLDCPIKAEPKGLWNNTLATLARADFVCGACDCPVNALCASRKDVLIQAKKGEVPSQPYPEGCWLAPILEE